MFRYSNNSEIKFTDIRDSLSIFFQLYKILTTRIRVLQKMIKNLHHLRNPKVHYCVPKNLLLDPILSYSAANGSTFWKICELLSGNFTSTPAFGESLIPLC
jgi:hypothetical protein